MSGLAVLLKKLSLSVCLESYHIRDAVLVPLPVTVISSDKHT